MVAVKNRWFRCVSLPVIAQDFPLWQSTDNFGLNENGSRRNRCVRGRRLELLQCYPLASETSASTNFATRATIWTCNKHKKRGQ
jgi:hypothetical protein